jgi:2-polyprenyl-3-methyl-5-hydroxy-6-metoxy-1,4-benzoquinol methylase
MNVRDIETGLINHCQICNSKSLLDVINLGFSGLCDSLLSKKDLNKVEKIYPLTLQRCKKCQLLQLNYVVDNKEVFHLDYPYKSGITKPLKKLLHSTGQYCKSNFSFSKKPLVVDIGSNDGTLLEGFKNLDFNVLGVEPTNISKIANEKGIKTIQKFFDLDTAKIIKRKYGKAEVITGTNIFAHVNKLDTFMKGVKVLLNSKTGIFVTESHYAVNIIDQLQFDSIYHEHLRFFLLKPLITLMKMYGFKVIDANKISNYGGSIRITASLNEKLPVNKSVSQILKYEKNKGFYDDNKYNNFSKKVKKIKNDLSIILWKLKLKNKKIVGAGCPGRSITLLAYCNITDQLIDYIAEQSSSLKLNLYTPSTHIQILDEKVLIKNPPDYVLILSWHYGKSVMQNLRNKGYKGKFIIPLPVPKIIN